MGLKSFSGDFPVLKDISIAKNYLNCTYVETKKAMFYHLQKEKGYKE